MRTTIKEGVIIIKTGQRIRQLRLAKGIKAQWVAAQIGVSPSIYHRIEAGKQNLSVERAQRIADALGVSVTDLLPQETEKKGGEHQQHAAK